MSRIVQPFGPPLTLIAPPDDPAFVAAPPPAAVAPASPEGKPDHRDAAAWLLLALITAADVESARQTFLDHVPRAFRGLGTGSGWTFDPARQVYLKGDGGDGGRQLGTRELKWVSLLLALAVLHELQAQAAYVADGSVPVAEWQRQTAATVKDLFVAQAALAAGGFDRLTPEVLDRVTGAPGDGRGLAFSLDRLRMFAQAIVDGQTVGGAGTESGIARRAGFYADASNPLFEMIRRDGALAARDGQGRRTLFWERNVLGDDVKLHCQECPELTRRGWVDIGTLPEIGTRTCLFRCACTIEYSAVGPARL